MLDQAAQDPGTDGLVEETDELYCAGCGHLVTRSRWAVARNGDHQHTVFNPAGVVFTIRCFNEAPGVAAKGTPTDEFTWFKGYDWQLVHCLGCGAHLGWQYSGDEVFFGLIKPKLTEIKH